MNKISFLPAVLAGASLAFVANAMPASAASFNLSSQFVTGNDANISNQFNIQLQDAGTGKVSFTFTNTGSISSSITDIYFGKQLSSGGISDFLQLPGSFTSTSGVSYAGGAAPPQPPYGEFGWTAAYTADSNSGGGQSAITGNGVNNYTGSGTKESITFTFNTLNGYNADNIYNAFGGSNPALAIAFHVQGINGNGVTGGSAWYGSNNVKPTDVPEPFTMLGTSAALGFGALFQRERSKRQKAQAKA